LPLMFRIFFYKGPRLNDFALIICFNFRMPEKEFETNKTAVVELLLEKNKNLGEESGKYWDVIANESYKFQKYELIADVVKTKLTRDIVLDFFDTYIAKDAPQRKKLSVQVFSTQHQSNMDDPVPSPETTTVIKYDSVSEFQNSMELFPTTPAADLGPFKP
jgi:secreted Zn-dependent insulinase-like peptidase